MSIYIFFLAVLVMLAVSDLVVGVSNDAVNFLNSSIGSKVAPRKVIMIIASFGILAGVLFSSGMMEVARKGIFHPEKFTMTELMVVFLAVMLTDILLLDFFNTVGLPTSTTVSIVFELLGAAVAVSLIKIAGLEGGTGNLGEYINTGKALAIIAGILLSVVVAFAVGSAVQFVTRLIFSFDFEKNLRRYGAVWGGLSLSAMIYFILIKGAKGASFMSPETLAYIKSHAMLIMGLNFVLFFLLFQILLLFTRVNILKIIILAGTFALALAFAANDLVNFIGVPLAGIASYKGAFTDGVLDPGAGMEHLNKAVSAETVFLLIAGAVMVITLWVSKKSRTVTETELNLGRQDDGFERFGSTPLSRVIVRGVTNFNSFFVKITPSGIRNRVNSRFDSSAQQSSTESAAFDQIRASVNLMVASVLIAYATSHKLPLSTTYVTFMVAMGTSFADRAWGRDSAVFRVTGVLTVIGGWFMTAFTAFVVSGIFALLIFTKMLPAVIGLLLFTLFIIFRNLKRHKKRETEADKLKILNLKHITEVKPAVKDSFNHAALYIQEIRTLYDDCFTGLTNQNRVKLKAVRSGTKKIQKWANIIIANIFKVMRLMHKEEVEISKSYFNTVGIMQEVAESFRDIAVRSFNHIDNNHKGLLQEQITELAEVKDLLLEILDRSSEMLLKKREMNLDEIKVFDSKMKEITAGFDSEQIKRIHDESSKTRLSILFYSVIRDSNQIGSNVVKLMSIFSDNFNYKEN